MDEPIAIEAKHLQEVLTRLTDRRIAVEKELAALGEAKKGAQDIFRHCRGFERAYSLMLQEATTAFKIRAVVEGSLPESLHKIPIEKRFTKAYVREICRQADGFQPHLVSPERGIKRLVQEAMLLTSPHVHRFVDEIHLVLLETVREAARRSVLTEAGIPLGSGPEPGKGMEFLRLKGFENAVILAATKALDEWKAEAHQVAETMVQMECDYVTPSFFRELEKEYQSGLMSEGGALDGAVEQPDDRMAQLARGMPPQHGGEESDDDSEAPDSAPPSARSAISRETSPQGKLPQLRDDLKAGWLEKRSGDSSSLNALPVDSWKWQRRWFVLAMESGFLYYFKSPEQMSTPGVSPKVTINLRDCVVEDFDAASQPSQKRSTQKLDSKAGGTVSLLIRISHRNPAMSVAKNHHQIILRAADAAEKYEWLARLRNASDSRGGVGKAPPIAGATSQQLAAQQQQQQQQQPGGSAAASRRTTTGGSEAPAPQPEQKKASGMFGRALDKVADRFSGFGNSKMGNMIEVGSIEDLDAYYKRLGNFTGLYARHIFNRMAKTVPKAIVLCQIIRSRDRLLDQLYNYLMSLKPYEVDALLAEDPTLVKRRNAAQQAAKELAEAQAEVKKIQEIRAATSPRAEPTALVTLRALLLAGAFPLIPPEKVPKSTRIGALYGDFTPVTLLQSVGDAAGQAVQLGAAALKATASKLAGAISAGLGGGGSSEGGEGAAAEAAAADGAAGSRPGSAAPAGAAVPVAPSPTAAAGSASSAAAKPRRQPPPPPPKM
ncbi:hypothetical protein ABPG75_005486 [Micractinium tetrahymenae]